MGLGEAKAGVGVPQAAWCFAEELREVAVPYREVLRGTDAGAESSRFSWIT